jgi:hypothetical protein
MSFWDRITGKSQTTTATSKADYALVDSREKAQALCAKGELHRVLMFPLEFGGVDGEMNVGYLTAKAAQEKAHIDSSILQLASQGKLHYQANQVYKGNSFVPAQVVITVGGTVQRTHVVDVW